MGPSARRQYRENVSPLTTHLERNLSWLLNVISTMPPRIIPLKILIPYGAHSGAQGFGRVDSRGVRLVITQSQPICHGGFFKRPLPRKANRPFTCSELMPIFLTHAWCILSRADMRARASCVWAAKPRFRRW